MESSPTEVTGTNNWVIRAPGPCISIYTYTKKEAIPLYISALNNQKVKL